MALAPCVRARRRTGNPHARLGRQQCRGSGSRERHRSQTAARVHRAVARRSGHRATFGGNAYAPPVLDLPRCRIEPQSAHRRATRSDCGRTQADRTGCVPWDPPECKSRLPLSFEGARGAGVGGSGQAVAPRRRQSRSVSRKKGILRTAWDCFTPIGLASATQLGDIRATQAGIGSIYYHFRSKEQLAAALYVEGRQNVVSAPRSTVSSTA